MNSINIKDIEMAVISLYGPITTGRMFFAYLGIPALMILSCTLFIAFYLKIASKRKKKENPLTIFLIVIFSVVSFTAIQLIAETKSDNKLKNFSPDAEQIAQTLLQCAYKSECHVIKGKEFLAHPFGNNNKTDYVKDFQILETNNNTMTIDYRIDNQHTAQSSVPIECAILATTDRPVAQTNNIPQTCGIK